MATYDEKRKSFSRTPVWFVKITLDFCAETFGVAPCVAVGTGDKKCTNTFFTCKDTANYNLTTKVYKFCSNGELPFNEGERPYIRSVKPIATEIKKSLPALGRIKIVMDDEPDTDVGIDPYVTERTSVKGTFWRKMLKRNPNYKGRLIEVYEGFTGLPESEYQLRFKGKLDNIEFGGNGRVEIEGIDFIGDIQRVKLPQQFDIKIGVDVSSAATLLTMAGADVDVLNATTGSTYYIRVNEEIIGFQSSNYDSTANQLSDVTRGVNNTPSESLSEDDDVRIAPHYNGNIFDVMKTLLTNPTSDIGSAGAGIESSFVDSTAFDFWRDFSGISTEVIVDGWIDEEMRVSEAYFDLADLMDVKTWVGEDNKITIARNVQNLPGRTYSKLTDDANIVINSDDLDLNEESRFTRNYLLWSYLPVSDFDKGKNFKRREVFVDVDLESSNAFAEDITKIDKTRFFRQGIMSQDAQNRFVQNRQRRWMQRRRNALNILDVRLEFKDSNIKTGEYCKVGTDIIVDDLGAPVTSAVGQVIKREVINNGVKLKLEIQPINKVCFIGPTSGAGGSSFYNSTNPESELEYGFIAAEDSASSTAAVMNDGSPAYLIF